MLGIPIVGDATKLGSAVVSSRCFESFCDVLRAQLGEVPEDFFVDIISGGNFMHEALRSLMNILEIDGRSSTRDAREQATVTSADCSGGSAPQRLRAAALS